MSEDPEKRDIDPLKDKVWAVDVYCPVDFTMYVVAESKEEAEECGSAHWLEEWNEGGGLASVDGSVYAKSVDQPIKDADWMNSIPWGRSLFRGRQFKVNEIIELLKNPPAPPPPEFLYDTQTILMPFADAPPPLRPLEAADA